MQKEALRYAENGYYIIPVWWIENGRCACGNPKCPEKSWGKHPITYHGLSDASKCLSTVQTWWEQYPKANIGLLCERNGFSVVDVDPRSGGDDSFNKLVSVYGELPITAEVSSGGGGSHYYFKYNKDFDYPYGMDLDGLDKRNNAYVIAPPSIHKSGNLYEWITDQSIFDIEIPDLPDFLINPKKDIDLDTRAEGVAEQDLIMLSNKPELRKEKFTFERNKDGSHQIIVNGKKSGAWIDTKGYIGSHSKGGPTAIQWIKWYGYNNNEATVIYNKYCSKEEPVFFKPITIKEFKQLEIPPLEYYIDGILQKKARTMISAKSNMGKSFFLINMLISLCHGEDFFLNTFEIKDDKPNALYLDLEMGESALHERIKNIKAETNLDNMFIQSMYGWNMLDTKCQKTLETFIEDKNINIVAFDPLGSLWLGDENKRESVKLLTDYFDSLLDRFGVSVIITHHWRKSTKDFNGGGEMAAGSYGWEKWLDNHVSINEKNGTTLLNCNKIRNQIKWDSMRIKLNEETMMFDYLGDFKNVKKFTDEDLLGIFRSFNQKYVRKSDIVNRGRKVCSKSTVYDLLKESKYLRTLEAKKPHMVYEVNTQDVMDLSIIE